MFAVAHADLTKSPGEDELELQEIKQQIAALTAQIQLEQQQRDADVKLLRNADERISHQSAMLYETEVKIDRLRLSSEQLEERIVPLQQQLERQREHLSHQVVSTWRMGRQQYLKLLLNQDDPVRLSRILSYYKYLNRARVDTINAIAESYRELKALNAALSEERELLQLSRADQNRILAELEQARAEQKQIIEHWNETIGSNERRLQKLSEDAKALDQLVKQIDKAIPSEFRKTSGAAFAQMKGSLNWPAHGRFLKHFGEQLSGGVPLEGAILALPEGRAVRAVHEGTVVFADWLRGYGMMMIIEHDAGYMTLYGYNQRLLKAVGDRVHGGEIVSLSGSSGGQQNASLYFAIRKGADSMNPAQWCRAASKEKVGQW